MIQRTQSCSGRDRRRLAWPQPCRRPCMAQQIRRRSSPWCPSWSAFRSMPTWKQAARNRPSRWASNACSPARPQVDEGGAGAGHPRLDHPRRLRPCHRAEQPGVRRRPPSLRGAGQGHPGHHLRLRRPEVEAFGLRRHQTTASVARWAARRSARHCPAGGTYAIITGGLAADNLNDAYRGLQGGALATASRRSGGSPYPLRGRQQPGHPDHAGRAGQDPRPVGLLLRRRLADVRPRGLHKGAAQPHRRPQGR